MTGKKRRRRRELLGAFKNATKSGRMEKGTKAAGCLLAI